MPPPKRSRLAVAGARRWRRGGETEASATGELASPRQSSWWMLVWVPHATDNLLAPAERETAETPP